MFKFVILSLFGRSLSQPLVGGERDTKNCLIGGGYTWCEDTQSCLRQWESPCADNFSDCKDCLMKQRNGYNIACPIQCDTFVACPEVMCAMYCENGFVKDMNGCGTCRCNELPNIVVDPMPVDPMPAPPIPNVDHGGTCEIPYEDCENRYACLKVTEVTQCSEGGLSGYTTYRVSAILKPNMDIRNIYAIYGHSDSQLLIPGSKQVENIYGSNLGGVPDSIIGVNPDSAFDSWLTIGVTNGNINNDLNTIGIDFSSWTEYQDLVIDNGAVFLMNPDIIMNTEEEIILSQFTVPSGSNKVGIYNIQGKKLTRNDNPTENIWKEENIQFTLNLPNSRGSLNTIPLNCESWYDGCNTCRVSNGVVGACTRMMCLREDTPYCMSFNSGH